VTLEGNRTLAVAATPAEFQVLRVRFTQDGGGGRTIAVSSDFVGGAPILNTTAAKWTDVTWEVARGSTKFALANVMQEP
jgi:hypothetical protein